MGVLMCDTEHTEREPDEDSEYQKEMYIDRKRREGWTQCSDCGDWSHIDDDAFWCKCDEKSEG